ncbi:MULTISPECIES: N-succinylarginine dihydrolase [unclassified Nitrosospira]|uniref:N-succinylarginine dihydrolase n=1 Tax=unclassified Nitrosospira TaxID=2609267 RepID=UPI000D30822C|nr:MULTISPECIES: N-succinylarginine dihydrolase [unclassified Nitrosospira]WON74017.1 N-succinylarginine dihydrolase [Nitrosospira sp. Is2]
MRAWEVNFDALVGPTHNYGGLAVGNLAAAENALTESNPREAALQGLAKMKRLADMGIMQAVLPPHDRPAIGILKKMGFDGDEPAIIRQAAALAPGLLRACCSASSMWVANAATISPGPDTEDGKVHITPANLPSQFHRSIEPPTTAAVLKRVFSDERYFMHHDPLPPNLYCADEGAANHMRLCVDHGDRGLEIFVFGRSADPDLPKPMKFPARQSWEASEAVCRLHRLAPGKKLFVQQNPDAIDAGAFHNDVLAVSNCNVLLYHEAAYRDWLEMEENAKAACGCPVHFIRAREADLSLSEAISTYLFNSQLISVPDGGMMILAPAECRESGPATAFLEGIIANPDNPVDRIEYVNLRQSMRNGGGPACLRLRVVLAEAELESVQQASRVMLEQPLYDLLKAWIERHYRDRILPADVADPSLLSESRTALDELTSILSLGPIYDFQKEWR